MAGHRPWREIKRPRSPANKERIAAGVRAMLLISDLAALREARTSRIELQHDLTLWMLEDCVRELGGELRVTAIFPDASVELVGKGGR